MPFTPTSAPTTSAPPTATPTPTAPPVDTATPVPTIPATETATPPTPIACVGDCNGDHEVTVDELVIGVNLSLGLLIVDRCPSFDPNDSLTVTINELILALRHASQGCGT